MYVDEYKLDHNSEIVKMQKIEFFCDKVHQTAGNFTLESIKTVNKFKVYFFLNIPENENDREFRKVLLKSVVDSDKFLSGVYANPVVRYVVGLIMESAQFELQLPIKPVRLCFQCAEGGCNESFAEYLQVRQLHAWRTAVSNKSDELDRSLQHAFCRKR